MLHLRLICSVMIAICATGGIAVANSPAYQLWSASSMSKILPDQTKPKDASDEITLYAAKGERESAQSIITTGSEPLKNVQVSLGSLSGPGGALTQIELCKVAYVELPNLKKIAPDPLPPATLFDVAANTNQPIWITITVPRNAEPGEYCGYLLVKPANAAEKRMPIRLKVWNFALPDGPSHVTAFGLNQPWIAQQHGVDNNSVAAKRLFAKYYDFLIDRWVSPYSLPVDVTSKQASRYIENPKVTSFTIPYNDDVEQMRKSVESLRSRGLLDKGYFYPIDEPFSEEAYKRLYEVCDKIHSIDPKLRIVIPYFRDPDFETGGKTIHELADGKLNIWCPNIDYFNSNKERLYAKLALGEEFWWYVCCGPGAPFPNYFLNMDGISHRVLPLMGWAYKCQGLLYWSTTWWSDSGQGSTDPWTDMATVKDINKDLYGDGSLLYPGKKVGVDGPVSSIRLELLREGLEDHEYLVLLEKKLGRSAVEKLVSKLITAPNDFNRDVKEWEKVRIQIGEELNK